MSRRKRSFMFTRFKTYGCKFCGQWQLTSGWDWVALLACKLHERRCEVAP